MKVFKIYEKVIAEKEIMVKVKEKDRKKEWREREKKRE